MPGHARPHDGAHLPARSRRPAGAVLWRHPVQRRRRQLPQRRPSGARCTTRSRRSSRGCRTPRAFTPVTSTSRATWSSRSIASPGMRDAQALLARARNDEPASAVVTTLAEEKRVNTFFRLQNPAVIARLREAFPDIGEQPGCAHGVREAAGAAQPLVSAEPAQRAAGTQEHCDGSDAARRNIMRIGRSHRAGGAAPVGSRCRRLVRGQRRLEHAVSMPNMPEREMTPEEKAKIGVQLRPARRQQRRQVRGQCRQGQGRAQEGQGDEGSERAVPERAREVRAGRAARAVDARSVELRRLHAAQAR